MKIHTKTPDNETAVAAIEGKLNIESVLVFEDTLFPLLDSVKKILLNCSQMDYIDSSGIGVMIKLMNNAKNKGIDLIMFNLQKDILKVFKIAYLDKFFSIRTEEEIKNEFPGIKF